MPVIDEDEMRLYVGGGTGTPGDPYTEDELNAMLDSGIWKGGYVDGFEGYVLPEISVSAWGATRPTGTTGNVSFVPDMSVLDNKPTGWAGALTYLGSLSLLSDIEALLGPLFADKIGGIKKILIESNYGAGLPFWVEVFQTYDLKVYDKDGKLIGEYLGGDKYVYGEYQSTSIR